MSPSTLHRLTIGQRLAALAIGDCLTLAFRPQGRELERFPARIVEQCADRTIVRLVDTESAQELEPFITIPLYHDTGASPANVWIAAVVPCLPDEVPHV